MSIIIKFFLLISIVMYAGGAHTLTIDFDFVKQNPRIGKHNRVYGVWAFDKSGNYRLIFKLDRPSKIRVLRVAQQNAIWGFVIYERWEDGESLRVFRYYNGKWIDAIYIPTAPSFSSVQDVDNDGLEDIILTPPDAIGKTAKERIANKTDLIFGVISLRNRKIEIRTPSCYPELYKRYKSAFSGIFQQQHVSVSSSPGNVSREPSSFEDMFKDETVALRGVLVSRCKVIDGRLWQ